MCLMGFEPTPPKRSQPKCDALDHSATNTSIIFSSSHVTHKVSFSSYQNKNLAKVRPIVVYSIKLFKFTCEQEGKVFRWS